MYPQKNVTTNTMNRLTAMQAEFRIRQDAKRDLLKVWTDFFVLTARSQVLRRLRLRGREMLRIGSAAKGITFAVMLVSSVHLFFLPLS